MSVVTTEVDADYFPGSSGTYNSIFTLPIRPGCSQLEFILTNNGDRNTAARYQMQAGTPTSYLNTGFNVAAGATDTKTYTTTESGPLTDWSQCEIDLGGNVGFVGTVHVKALQTWSGEAGVYCLYGTQLQPDASFVVYLTPGLIDVILTEMGLIWLAPLFTAFWFTYVNVKTLCSTGPPPMPEITLETITSAGPGVIWQALQAVMWPYFCECSPAPPGGVPPIPPGPPGPPQPINWPPTPTLDCDDTSLCTLVHQLMQSVASLQQTVIQDYQVDTLVQRQGVPFGYIVSTAHTGLTGNGELVVADLIGILVQATDVPGWVGLEVGTPDELWVIGRISFGTADGYGPKVIVSHNPEILMPIDGAITRIGYSLTAGVVANIVELVREP